MIREQVETNRARTTARIATLVRWAFDQPEFPHDVDIELSAHAIRHLSEEAGRMVLTNPERFTPERYDHFVRAVVGLVWPRHAAAH